MMDILNFIFSDFLHFAGTTIIIASFRPFATDAIINLSYAKRSK